MSTQSIAANMPGVIIRSSSGRLISRRKYRRMCIKIALLQKKPSYRNN